MLARTIAGLLEDDEARDRLRAGALAGADLLLLAFDCGEGGVNLQARGRGMNLIKGPLLRAYLVWHYRRAAVRRLRPAMRYLVRGRETTNFTYEVANLDELVAILAAALGVPRDTVDAWLAEVAADERFVEQLRQGLASRHDREDEPMFGRRLGWYCIVRHARPSLVVETGSHDGLGTALLLRALEWNANEGADGTLVSLDIDPDSGWLVPEQLRSRLERHVGDARVTLEPALSGRRVGVFVHDSLHTYEHERFELELAAAHADTQLYLISDNAHASAALADVCRERGVPYAHYVEEPLDHFYPGAALGLGVVRAPATSLA